MLTTSQCWTTVANKCAILQYHADLSGVARILHWGAQKLSAEGARMKAPEAPRGWRLGRGFPLPQPITGSGGALWAPPAGSGASPGRHRIFWHIWDHKTLLVERTVLLYWIKQALRPTKTSFSLKIPLNRRLGRHGPFPTSGYAPDSSEFAIILALRRNGVVLPQKWSRVKSIY